MTCDSLGQKGEGTALLSVGLARTYFHAINFLRLCEPSRVFSMNDETPVRTNPEGMFTPIDFTTFMRNYQNMVFSTAVRLVGNEAQAEDISQEVFLKAYQHFDNLQTSKTAGGGSRR